MSRKSRNDRRKRRHLRVRSKVEGTAPRPRLNVFRSLDQIYAQLIDDEFGNTLASASSLESKVRKAKKASKINIAKDVGDLIAERAKKLGIDEVVFDRGGYQYHGRIKALADGARAAGIKF